MAASKLRRNSAARIRGMNVKKSHTNAIHRRRYSNQTETIQDPLTPKNYYIYILTNLHTIIGTNPEEQCPNKSQRKISRPKIRENGLKKKRIPRKNPGSGPKREEEPGNPGTASRSRRARRGRRWDRSRGWCPSACGTHA